MRGCQSLTSETPQGRLRFVATNEPDYFAKQVQSAHRFYLRLSPAQGRRARIGSGGLEICSPDYDVARPNFPFLTLELVIKGAGTLTLNSQSHPLTPGTAYLYGGPHPHRICADGSKGMSKYFVTTNGSEVLEWLSEADLLFPSIFQVRGLAELTHLFDLLTQTGRGDRSDRERLCTATFQHLLMRMGELSVRTDRDQMTALATYRRCRAALEEGYLRFQTVQELAAACHIAPEYLCRLFKRFRRQTPFQYLQGLKMNRAVELLHDGKHSVKEVAEQIGFSDPYHFSRAFKRHYGIPPVRLLSRPDHNDAG